MLQRIQTLWLLLATTCAVLTLKFSFFSGNKPGQGPVVAPGVVPATQFKYLTATSNIILLILTVAIIVATLVNVFNYKNRKLQMRITLVLLLVSLLNIFIYFQQTKNFIEGNYDLTAFLAFAIPVFFFMASRGIYRDEKLVRSTDRLR